MYERPVLSPVAIACRWRHFPLSSLPAFTSALDAAPEASQSGGSPVGGLCTFPVMRAPGPSPALASPRLLYLSPSVSSWTRWSPPAAGCGLSVRWRRGARGHLRNDALIAGRGRAVMLLLKRDRSPDTADLGCIRRRPAVLRATKSYRYLPRQRSPCTSPTRPAASRPSRCGLLLPRRCRPRSSLHCEGAGRDELVLAPQSRHCRVTSADGLAHDSTGQPAWRKAARPGGSGTPGSAWCSRGRRPGALVRRAAPGRARPPRRPPHPRSSPGKLLMPRWAGS